MDAREKMEEFCWSEVFGLPKDVDVDTAPPADAAAFWAEVEKLDAKDACSSSGAEEMEETAEDPGGEKTEEVDTATSTPPAGAAEEENVDTATTMPLGAAEEQRRRRLTPPPA